MMNDTLSSATLATADTQSLQAIGRVLDLLADANRVKQTIQALQDASTEAAAQIEKARTESAALDEMRKDHAASMAADRLAFDAELKNRQATFENECGQRRQKLSEAEAAARVAHAAAEEERKRSLTLNTDLESRLSMIQGAATAPLPARN
jgi:hypothetical protein